MKSDAWLKIGAAVIGLAGTCGVVIADQAAVTFAAKPSVTKTGNGVMISFALTLQTDVEVAILDAKGAVVRHLAAGVLGVTNAPPAPLKPGLAQSLEWDGKDDYGDPCLVNGELLSVNSGPSESAQATDRRSLFTVHAPPLSVRVRAGMGAKLEKIIGGDPYAFWSENSSQGDHAQWKVTGLQAKADGNVYILGYTTAFGHPAIRQYDARGNFIRTVFPPPASLRVPDVAGWGVNSRDDGSWMLRGSFDWCTYVQKRVPLCGGQPGGGTWCGSLTPTPENDTLCIAAPLDRGNARMIIGADGKLPKADIGKVIDGEALPKQFAGALFCAISRDGRSEFVAGLRGDKGGPWRDRQIWKVDYATREASPFFALDETNSVAGFEAVGASAPVPFMAIQGLAVDGDGNVFACDRQNKRVLVLDANGKIVRSLNVANPDAVAVHPKTKTLYVTTRFGSYGGQGKLHLLKFADWSKDTDPVQAIPLSETVGKFASFSHVAVALDKDATFVWTAYTTLPARVFREGAAGLELVKDFYQSGPRQRALDMQHMMLDQKTGDAYLADSSGFVFRVRDWNKPQFELCMHDAKTKMVASSIAIDSQQRTLFARYHWGKPVNRWKIDGEFFTPAPVGAAGHAITGKMNCGWDFCGLHERGMAAAPGGGLAVLAGLPDLGHRADDYSGPLHFFKPDPAKAPWTPLHIKTFGDPRPNTAGVRFDPRGNLYVGVKDGQVKNIPKGFANDPDFGNDPWQGSAARIYKFAPTGSGQNGDWFPTAPDGPAKIYEINFGALAPSANFGVDGYGRLYYPTGMLPQVSVIDNEGNRILAFGTYGNRDSMGGLNGDLEPDQDVPLARPSSVDADDDFIYVTDIINVRLLRLAKTFRLEAAAKIQPRLAN